METSTKEGGEEQAGKNEKHDAPSYPFRAKALHFSEPGHPKHLERIRKQGDQTLKVEKRRGENFETNTEEVKSQRGEKNLETNTEGGEESKGREKFLKRTRRL